MDRREKIRLLKAMQDGSGSLKDFFSPPRLKIEVGGPSGINKFYKNGKEVTYEKHVEAYEKWQSNPLMRGLKVSIIRSEL